MRGKIALSLILDQLGRWKVKSTVEGWAPRRAAYLRNFDSILELGRETEAVASKARAKVTFSNYVTISNSQQKKV